MNLFHFMRVRLALVGLALALAIFAQTAPSHADVVYSFAFTGLNNGKPNFNVSVTEPNFITTTGLQPLSSPISTPLYTLNNFGTDIFGEFAFSGSGGGILDGFVAFSSTTFLFEPNVLIFNYITAAGTYAGTIHGNDSGIFDGQAVLTVTAAAVPAPIVGAGLPGLIFAGGGLLGWRRRKRKAEAAA
jgi:hypothetical protein